MALKGYTNMSSSTPQIVMAAFLHKVSFTFDFNDVEQYS